MQIYLTRNGKAVGPFPVDEIRRRLNQGEIQLDDLAWHDGLAEWTTLGDIPGLIPPPPPSRTKTSTSSPITEVLSKDLSRNSDSSDSKSPRIGCLAFSLLGIVLLIMVLAVGAVAWFKIHNASKAPLEPNLSSSGAWSSINSISSSSFSQATILPSSSSEPQILNSTLRGHLSIASKTAPAWLKHLADSTFKDAGQSEDIRSRRYHFVDLDGDGQNEAIVFSTQLSSDGGNSFTQSVAIFTPVNGIYQSADKMNIGGKLSTQVKTDTLQIQQNKFVLKSLDFGPEDSNDKPTVDGRVAFQFKDHHIESTPAPKIVSSTPSKAKSLAP